MKYLFAILISIFSFSCTQQKNHEFDFLEGTWQVEGKEQFEKWEKRDDQLLGYGYKITDGQELVLEKLAIVLISGEFVYQATVAGQNQGMTISFPLNKDASDFFSFENPKHDFPKKIQYQVVHSRRLKVNVLGAGENGFSFFLNRVND